jgi:hypothetical protein
MGVWYTIGLLAGFGCACGILAAGVLPRYVFAALLGAAAGFLVGFYVWDWDEGVAAAVGGVLGGAGATPVVSGALRRGGTRIATAALIGATAIVVAGIAFVPVLGYVEAAVLPALGLRLRRREPERHAGLRTLARD